MIKHIIGCAILIAGCGAAKAPSASPTTGGGIYEVVNGSNCVARIVLHDAGGQVIETMKFRDLQIGRTERYRVPSIVMRLTAVPVNTVNASCGMTEAQKIKVTKVE
jgi:hypothetical protein